MPNYPCPCCGYLVFEGEPGSAEVCPVCYWEDDRLHLEFATTLSDWSNGPTLLEAQRNFVAFGACEERLISCVNPPATTLPRDRSWRPIDPALDRFESHDAPARRAPIDGELLYYWRETYWMRLEVRDESVRNHCCTEKSA